MADDGVLTDAIDPVSVGVRLADARRARGFTQQQAAEVLGVARTTIVAMEKGDRRPRAVELVRLADLYGRQVGELTRPIPPDRPASFVVQFRSARGSAVVDERRNEDIHGFQSLCEDYAELERLTDSPLPRHYPEVYRVGRTDPDRAGEEVAASERNRLGLGDGPVGDLWGTLESDVGLRVFAPPFAGRDAGMFVYADAYGGCIAVNGNHPEERRRWTVVHEYCHFLVDRFRPEITILPQSKRVPEEERLADAFARCFLMPAAGVVRRFQAMKRAKSGPITPADVLTLAHLYRVSFTAMMLRLEGLDLLPSGSWDRLRAQGFKANAARAIVDLPPIAPEIGALPLRYQILAVRAYENDLISEGQLARFLRTDRISARKRVEELLSPAPDYDAGAWRQVPIDLSAALVGVS